MDEKPKTPQAKLYSVKEGKVVDWDLRSDVNGEVIATHGEESLKFPHGLTKVELLSAFKAHNEANDGLVGLTEEEQAAGSKQALETNDLLNSL